VRNNVVPFHRRSAARWLAQAAAVVIVAGGAFYAGHQVQQQQRPPLPVQASGEGWQARRTMERKDGAIEATWEATVSRVRYAPDQVQALKELWGGLRKTSALQLQLGD